MWLKSRNGARQSRVLKAMMKRKEVGLCTEDARKSVEAGQQQVMWVFWKGPCDRTEEDSSEVARVETRRPFQRIQYS